MSQSMKKKFPSITSIDVGTDGNTSFLRAARNGQLDKVLEHLKSNIDINTSNANGLNALHLASKDGHVEIVEELLKRGAVVDAATKKGNTALHIASLAGQEEVVKLLVNHGASVNVQSQNGFTPLYMAAQENHDNVVKYLLANGANQSLSTEDGFTPLAVAMQQGHDKVVTVLLENDTRGKVRLPALHIAAKKDDVKAAKLLLENEHNPDVTSKSGFTPLHIASHYGNQSIANLLVQKGADVNYSAKHNITPLHVAAKWGKTNMVTVLMEQGANIESKTRDGLTPLHCAARSGHEQVVDMLLEKGAPISSKTKNGLAPLHMAAQGDHVDAARILLYHRAPVDEVTVDYLTALHVAAHCGHVRVAKLLLDRQADANARALNGFTPLHIACKKNRIKVVELLLKHGASIGATTESGLTPLHVASFMGCMNIVIYLLQHDANPDVPTVRGETPLHLAARANQTDIIRILLRNGAQVDARAREQQTPLHIASRLGNVDIVMLLLQHGAKVDNTTKDMYTSLHIAAKEGQDEVAASLIDNGASLNATTKKGFTPLHLAAKYGHLKVAKLLLQKEAPVDAQGKNGVTPLHVASHYDHQNVALLLLEKGASPYATAKNGHTPLHIAAKKNQMDIANTLLEYGAKPNAESKAGFTPLHLSAQEGHSDMSDLLIEHQADTNHRARNGLTPLHLCAQEDKVLVAEVLVKNGGEVDAATKNGYTPLHTACHYGQVNMVKFLLAHGANVKATTSLGYTPLHQAAQQGHTNIVNALLENSAQPNAVTNNGQTPLHIAQKLGYITVIDTLKVVTEQVSPVTVNGDEKYRVVAPEAMHETFMSDSEEEGGEDTLLGDQTYRYLTADEMKSLGDDSLPIDVTRDERIDSNKIINCTELPPQNIEDNISPEHVQQNYVEYIKKYTPDNIDIDRHPISIGFLVSFLVDARGGAMRGCRHSGVRVIVPPRSASSPTRITCRYVRPQRTPHPPPLMEGEALASRVLELGPVGAKFLGPVIIEVPHFAALRGKEREIVILRSDNGESWKEHTVDATEEILNEVLHDSFEAEDLNQLEDISSGRITRIVTQDFPQYFAVVSRIRQEVHAIGPEGGMVSSTVVPQVQAVFPQGALTKKIKVGLQAQPIDPELTAKLLGHGVAVSPVVTVEPRRRKFHKAITLSMPAPRAHSQGMINQYSGSAPTLRLLCSITGGTSRAQWEDVTGSTPLTFVNDCVSFTTTVSARFWLMDCRNVGDATKMATELYREAIHVPFMAKFVVFAKRVDPLEARLRVFCMTDDKEDKTLEHQEHFTEVAKSRDVEVLEGKPQYIEFAGNLVPITKSGEQLQFSFRAFRENRLPFSVRVKDQHAEAVSRCLFMREAKVPKGEPPQQPICILNIVLPDDIVVDTISLTDTDSLKKQMFVNENFDYYRPDPRLADMSNLLGEDWVPLAAQLGLTTSEINVIKSEYPDSVAKQAQSMLRMWLSQSGNKAQANTLESALRRIGREDIIPQCLNVDYAGHGLSRIKTEEIGKQRLTKKIATPEEKDEVFDKYSAEEKAVETSDEEDFNKTVTERRHQIEERLSVDRTVPASSQRVEIVQEITSIKRQSLVENKIAVVEQKAGKDVVDVKTTLPSESATAEEAKAREGARRDSELLEGVTQRFETPKKTITKITSSEDPNSPKFSKTPPPSPADFAIREPAAAVQEWDVAKKSSPPEETPGDAQDAEQGLSTTTELIDGNEPVGQPLTGFSHLVIDQTLLDQTNAFIQSESQPEPYDISIDTKNDMSDKKADDNKHNINEKKKAKKGFFGSIKTFVKESFESDSDSEKSPKKAKKDKKKKRGKEESLPPKKPKLPTPPLEPSDLDAIPFVEDMPPPYRPPEVPVTDLDEPPVEEAPTAPHAVKEETSPPSKPKEEKLRKSKSREKSPKRPPKVTKTIVVEEVTKTIEPLVVETEEFSIVVDPTRKESPKKSKETFTINIDESIEKIEKEIMEKSPILPEEKILKPIVDLDAPIRPPRLKDHVYEDIQEPELSPPPDHIINVSNITEDLIKSEIHFAGWSDDPHNVSNKTEVVEKLKKVDEIIEKHDKEVLKEKELEGSPKPKQKDEKGGFFGLFKKSKKDDETKFPEKVKSPEKTKNEVDTIKSSEEIPKTDAQLLFSDIVVQEMADSTKFLQGEVDSYHDVRPKVQAFAEEVIEVELPESSAEPGGFFNLFKKSKKDEEKSPKKTVTEVKPPIEMKAEEKPLLSESALDDMARTGTFVTDKGIVAEIKPQDLEVVTTEVIAIRDDEEKPVKIKSRESSEERGGFFGFFKKSKKDEETAAIKSPEKSSSPDAKKKIEEPKSAAKDMADTNKFLIDEVQNYHDVKPELTQPREETLIIEKVSETVEGKIGKPIKVKSRESSEERSGFFGLFKKSKHDEEMSPEKKAGEAKATLSDVVITNMANTRQFLNDEVENYHDVRPQPVQLWAEKQFSDELVEIKVTEKPKIKSRESSEDRGGPFGLFKKSKKENDIEFGPPEEKSLLEQTVIEDKTDTRKFLIEDQRIWDENIDIDETIKGEGKAHKSKSRESSLERGLLGFFKKSKKDEDSKSPEKKKKKEETSTSVIKAMVDTDKFLEDGVKHYDDVKPAEQVATETEKVVSKTEDLLESSAPKMTSRESSLERGMVGFFKPRTSEDLKFREKKRRFDDKSLYSESMAKERAAIEAIMRSDEYHLDSHAEIVEKYDELMKAEARLEQAQGRGKSRESSQERSLFGFFKKSKKDSKSPEQIKRIHRKRAMDEPLSSESEDEHRDDHDTKLNLTKLNKEDLVKSEEAVVETKVTVLKMKSPESSEEPSGFFGLFKKSRKDEDPAKFTERKIKGKPPFLSDSVVNDIINTTSFLEMEVKHYHDAKPEIRKPHEEKLIVESDIGEVVEEKSKTKSRESSLERGLLGFFKKSKKDEDSKPEKKKKIKNKSLSFAESVVKDGTSPDTFVKEVETSHSTKHKVPKQSEEVGKVNERLVKHETILDETAAKVKSRESSQERGLFGFFKKAKKESKSPEPIKRIHRKRSMSFPSDSEDETRDDHDTKLDLTKPNKEDLVKSEEIVTKAEEKVQSPEKKIEEKLAISDSVAMDKSNTSKFLEDEVQHYHDAKPKVTKPLEDILIIETDNVDIQPELADQIPKDISGEPSEDRSGFFGLFKKSKKDEDQKLPESRKTEATSTFSDSVIKDMDDTGKFLSDEVQRYHDVKTETSALSVAEEQLAEIKPERGTETEVSSKVKSQGSSEERGFFGLLKKPSKDEEKLSAKRLDEVKLTATESVVNELEDTNRFLIDEVKNYHDVKTELCVKSEENAGAESKVLGTPLHEGKAPKIKSRESSQERGFLGLFKKSKKDEEASPEKKKKLAISDSVLKDMTDTGMFLDGEVQNYHDVRPEPNVIASEDIVDIKTEVAASQEQPFIIKSSESSEERTGFLGLFKKSKKDEGQSQEKKKKGDIKPVILQDVVDSKRFLEDEVQNYHDVKSESIALIEEPAIITAEVLDTKSAPSVEEKPPKIKSRESSEERGFLGLFKKSKKDEEKSPEKKKKTETKPAVSEEAVKDMADTSKFLQDEVKNYHDAKPEPTSVIKEEKLTESEVTLEDRSFKIASRESSEERSGFFGFFKKSKKEEESRLPDRKHIVLSDSVLKNMADTSQFLNDEVQNYHDAKPEHTINETEWEKIEVIEAQVEGKSPKVKSRESSEERTGFLGFFKKPRKDHEEVHEKPSISEAVIKDMADTQQFLGKEVQHYHDVKLQGTEATAEMISTKAVESHEESKTKESPKKVKSRESSEERGGLFGLFKKSKKDEEKTAVPQIALKDADETAQGFGEEAENYESVVTKPIKAVEETVVVGTEITDTKAGAKVKLTKAKSRESSEERGSFLGFFKKSKKDEEVVGEPSEAIIKEMADTKNFLSCEVQHYHDEKPVIAEETAERAEGQATKLTEVETKPEIRDDDSAKSIEGPLKKSDDSAIKDMADTAQFLSGEVQHYHDVKTMSDEIKKKAAAAEEVGKVLPTEEEGVVKEPSKSGFFGLFKKSKKDEGGSPEKTRKSESEERTSSAVKVITDTNQFLTDEVQNYHDVMPEGQTIVTTETVVKTQEINEPTALVGILKKSRKEDRITELASPSEVIKEISEIKDLEVKLSHEEDKPGLFGLFKKSKKDEEKTAEILEKSDDKPAISETGGLSKALVEPVVTEVFKESTEAEPQKKGFLSKFKKVKRKPSLGTQLSQEVLKDMADTNTFLKTEVENYEDEKLVGDLKLLEQLAPVANDVEEKSVTFDDVVEVASDLPLEALEVDDVVKIDDSQDSKLGKKDKKGFFNIFGKKSKSQDASIEEGIGRPRDDEGSSKKPKEKRRKSSPFKFFDKKKSEEDFRAKSEREDTGAFIKTELENYEDSAGIAGNQEQDEVWIVESENITMDLTQEVLDNLERKIDEMNSGYSKEIMQDIQNCNDFLYLEMYNYDDGKPEVVTDLDKGIMELSWTETVNGLSGRAVDDIVDAAIKTAQDDECVVLIQMEETIEVTEENLDKQEDKTKKEALAKVEETSSLVKTKPESIKEEPKKKEEEPKKKEKKPRKHSGGFLSKLGGVFSGASKDVEEKTEKLSAKTKELEKSMGKTVEEISKKPQEISSRLEETVGEAVDVTSKKAEGFKQVAGATVDKTKDNLSRTTEATGEKLVEAKTKLKGAEGEIMDATDDATNKVSATLYDVKDATKKKAETVKEIVTASAQAGTEKFVHGLDNLAQATVSRAEDVKETSKGMVEKLGQKKDVITEASGKSALKISRGISDLKEAAGAEISYVEEGVKTFGEEILDDANKAKKAAKDQFSEVRDDTEALGEKIIDDLQKKKETAKQTTGQLAEEVEGLRAGLGIKVTEVKEDISKKKKSVKETTKDVLDATKAKFEEAKFISKTIGTEIRDDIVSKRETAKETTVKFSDQVGDSVDALKGTTRSKVDEISESAGTLTKTYVDKVHKKEDDLKEVTKEIANATKEKVDECKDKAKLLAADVSQELTKKKDVAKEVASTVSSQVIQKLEDLQDDTEGKMQKVCGDAQTFKKTVADDLSKGRHDVKDFAEDTAGKVADEISEHMKMADVKIDHAKSTTQAFADEVFQDIARKTEKAVESVDHVKSAGAKMDQMKRDTEALTAAISEDFSNKKQSATAATKEVIADVGKTVQDKVGEAQAATEAAAKLAAAKKEEANKALLESEEMAASEFESFADEAKETISKGLFSFGQSVGGKFDEVKTAAASKVDDLSKVKEDTKQEVVKMTSKGVSDCKQAADESQDQVLKKKEEVTGLVTKEFGDLSHTLESGVVGVKEKTREVVEDLGKIKQEIVASAAEEVDDIKGCTKEKMDQAADEAIEEICSRIHEVEKSTIDLKERVDEVSGIAADTSGNISDDLHKKVKATGDKVEGMEEQTRRIVQDVGATVVEASADIVTTASEGAKSFKGAGEEKISDTKASKKVMFEEVFEDLSKKSEGTKDALAQKIKEVETSKVEGVGQIEEAITKKKDVVERNGKFVAENLHKVKQGIGAVKETVGTEVDSLLPKFRGDDTQSESDDSVPYVTSPTMARRAVSQRYSSEERPAVREVSSVKRDDGSDDECYIVTEPEEEHEDTKRKPMFRLESEDDDSLEGLRPVERSDSVKSNVLETLTETKLENLLSNLVQDLADSGSDVKEKTSGKVAEVEVELEQIKKDSEADVDEIEKKLRDLDKALDSLEQATDPKMEKKLHRVERKFERMASDVLEKDVEEVSPTEVATRRENEFQKLVSQLSTEEVSDFQKEYSHLWDETTFSKTDEWDSKTPDSQVEELPQGEEAGSTFSAPHEPAPPLKAEGEESAFGTQRSSDQQRSVSDQHQLSEEMKQLLKELEKESKQ